MNILSNINYVLYYVICTIYFLFKVAIAISSNDYSYSYTRL